ncbi:M-phase inducer phosphatase 1-A-like [Pelobates fuscus]|uniref:M-phase inducer phosphatase 1-A-like n=1 Tax=Pelobates fuscus TaxID=191477 RepID=UPI002FE44E55
MSCVVDDEKLGDASFLIFSRSKNELEISNSSLDEVLTFSPDLGLSPVTGLTGNMGHLKCKDRLSGITPRRRLKLSPDSQNPSPTDTTCQLHPAMGTATEFPNESTPKVSPEICSTSDYAFETRAWKTKKIIRRNKARENENVLHQNTRKKSSRMKLLELFQSPECIARPQPAWLEKGTPEQQDAKKQDSSGDGDHNLSMCISSPKCNITDSEDDELIGDFSKCYCLPIENGKHQDLKYINSTTLAQLLRGSYKDIVQKYWVVDCRYPYEFAGGHIKGAKNLFREEHIAEEFLKHPSLPESRTVLVFHCEFSSERAPKLCRLLRNMDRKANVYPLLYYPELYVLKGGYKDFYETFKVLCEPQGYVNMLHRDFQDHLKQYHRKKNSFAPHRVRKELFKPQSTNKIMNQVKSLKS